MATVTLAQNAVIAQLVNPTREVAVFVTGLLSYEVEAGLGASWSGKSSFFEVKNNTFPAGFVYLVQAELTKIGHTVNLVRRPHATPLGPENPIVDEFGNDNPDYDFQPQALRQVEKHGAGIIRVATGGGKCLGKDTPVMMFDGTIKPIQDIVIGDFLMGPDSTPRRVLSTCTGRAPLYRVTPTKGDAYVVNDAHILSLKKTSRGYRGRNRDGEKYPKGEIVNINVEDYLRQNKTFRRLHKGWRTGVEFPIAGALRVDPYFVGALLGDGSIAGTVSLTTADQEMVSELESQATTWGLNLMPYTKAGNAASTYHLTAGHSGGKINPLTNALRSYGLGAGEKFVPHAYKVASRADRLAMLAGLLDTDGYWDGKGFYLTLKSERLLDDVIFVARSLGFAAYKRPVSKTCTNNGKVGTYFAICITGEGIENIPVRLDRRKPTPRTQKKDVLVHGIKVEPIGEGDYYGFEIDGDHLFLLGDFTVTHNTKIAKLIFARYQRMTLFLTTRGILLYQMDDQLKAMGLTTGQIGDGEERLVNGINLGMVQTLVQALEVPNLGVETRAIVKSLHLSKNKDTKMPREQILALAQAKVDAKTRRRAQIIRMLEMIEVVIGEEAHEAGGASYFEILRHCKNASIRVALTATPFMRDSAADNMRLMAAFGPILINVSEDLLIKRGILAKPYFRFVDCKPPALLRKTSPFERAYSLGYVENEHMLAAALKDARTAKAYRLPTLALVARVKHGETVMKTYREAGLNVEFLRGEDKHEERRRTLARLAAGEIDVVIGTTILDVGVDVPAIGLLQLLGGMKAEVSMRQRIGRALRRKKGVNVALVVDYSCNANSFLSDHARQRRNIVLRTEGFVDGILPDGQDFNWSLFQGNL